MKHERIKCLTCELGREIHTLTGDIMHVTIKIDLGDLPDKECPNEKCKQKTLVKA